LIPSDSYTYCANNPLRFVDHEGEEVAMGESEKETGNASKEEAEKQLKALQKYYDPYLREGIDSKDVISLEKRTVEGKTRWMLKMKPLKQSDFRSRGYQSAKGAHELYTRLRYLTTQKDHLIRTISHKNLGRRHEGYTAADLKFNLVPLPGKKKKYSIQKSTVTFSKGAGVNVGVSRKVGAKLGSVLMHEYMCHAYQLVKYRSGQTMTVYEWFKNSAHYSNDRANKRKLRAFPNLQNKYSRWWRELPNSHPLKMHGARKGRRMATPQTVADKIAWWVAHYR
jgi:hypothetical protein